jgi:RHS repeat-associated protein
MPPGIQSFADIDQWWEGFMTQPGGGACSTTRTGVQEIEPGEPGYGIAGKEISDGWYLYYLTLHPAQDIPGNPPILACSLSETTEVGATMVRTVKCPDYAPVTGTAPNQECEIPPNYHASLKLDCPCHQKIVKGEPVDVSDGNAQVQETDYEGGGTDSIKFVRTYNSVAAYQQGTGGSQTLFMTSLGVGWSADYFQYLTPVIVAAPNGQPGTTVYAHRPNGTVLAFVLYNGAYSPDGDVKDSLILLSNGNWEYQTADDTIETYNSSGMLLSLARRGQSPVTISYEANAMPGNPPSSVSDAFGHSLLFGYLIDASNMQRLASITDPAGGSIQYAYDSAGHGNLITVTYQDSSTRAYTYGGAYGNMLTSIFDEASVAYDNWTYTNYDQEVASTQLAGGVGAYSFTYTYSSPTWGPTGSATVVDPLGQSRTYGQQLMWGSYYPTSTSVSCPGCGESSSLSYDAYANVTSRTDFNGNVTNYSYDPMTNLEISRTEAYGTAQARTITTQWDVNWFQPDLITEPNRTLGYTYDSMGNALTKVITDTSVSPNVSRTWTYTYDSYGRVLTARGPRTDVSSTTTYTYYTCTTGNQCGEVQTVTDPVGNLTTYNTYNAHGRPLTITDPNGVVITLTYDARLRLTSRHVGTEATAFSYYPTGLLQRVTQADSSYLQYTYDGAHRLTMITDGSGNYIAYTLDNMGNRTAEKSYDPVGTLHRTHTRAFNTLNELYQDIDAAGTPAVTTSYAHDNQGNQTGISAPLSRNTTDTYDPLNRLNEITDPANGQTQFSYDANDNLTSVKDPRNLTTGYTYNGFGNLVQKTSPDTGTGSNVYDSGGNLSVATDSRGSAASYSYDALNRVTRIVYSNSGVTDQTLTFGYDAGTFGKGRLTSAGDANESLSWTYDFMGRVVGKAQAIGTVTMSLGYGYTSGDMTSEVTPSGQQVAYGYNSNHQVTSISINGTSLVGSVTYEPFGAVNGWTWGNGSNVTRGYDGNGQVTAIGGNVSVSLTYNPDRTVLSQSTSGPAGFDTAASSTAVNVASDSNRISSATGGLTRTYSYDNVGNTLSDGTHTFTYNAAGRMTSATSAGVTTSYTYNALGQRVEKSSSAGTTLFMYDEAGRLVGEYDGTGQLIEEIVWLGDVPMASVQPGQGGGVGVFYINTDQLGAPISLSRTNDNVVVWQRSNDPFGAGTVLNDPDGNGSTVSFNLRFPGQYYDQETGLNYNYSRDYDPAVGRYVESDPMGLAGGSYSTYAYANANPISQIDPLGLWTYQMGLSLSYSVTVAGIGFGYTGGFGFAIDGHGDITSYSYRGPGAAFGTPGISGGVHAAVSNGNSVCDLAGPFHNVSLGGGWGPDATGDGFWGTGSNGQRVEGGGLTLGAGIGASAFVGQTTTTLGSVGHLW